jgi:hypothetical protein
LKNEIQKVSDRINNVETINSNNPSAEYQGKADALEYHNSSNWWTGGFLFGLTLGPIGYLHCINANATRPLPNDNANINLQDKSQYVVAYSETARKQNFRSAASGVSTGLLLSSVAWTTIVLIGLFTW